MGNAAADFLCREIDISQLDAIQPLWEKLKEYHARLSIRWAASLRARTFERRKQELLAKARGGKLKIDIACGVSDGTILAYCYTSLSLERKGEIESLYVDANFRGRGIGTELMRRALAWLDAEGAESKTVSVLHGNDEAVSFYARFGFHPRTIELRQS